MMLREKVEALLSFLEKREYQKTELATIASNFLSLVLSSRYAENQKYNIIIQTRKKIKERLGTQAPILDFLKPSEQMLKERNQKKNDNYQKSMRNKVLISYPDSLDIIQRLVESVVPSLNFLGFYLATGRRLSEARSENFSVVEDYSFSFKGQLKTRKTESYLIPTLYPASRLLETLIIAESIINIEPNSADYQVIQRYADRIFGENIHKLRAKYCALILKKEGCLESDSKIDPILRAKEILGHEWETDATFAYQKYRVSDKPLAESEKIRSSIKAIEVLQSNAPLKTPYLLGSKNSVKENLTIILQANPFLMNIDKREASTIIRKEYERSLGAKLNSNTLKNFLWENGIIKDLSSVLRPDEERLLKRIENCEFSKEDKNGIIYLYKLYRNLKTRRCYNLETAKEVLREDFREEELLQLKEFFKGLK